jgi:hypothetical protein
MQKDYPRDTIENSKCWRIFHSANYLNGGICYFIGSALLFSIFSNSPIAASISGWIYTIGSLTFLIADIT